MSITLLLADPYSENMAAFCFQDKCTDRKSRFFFYRSTSSDNFDDSHLYLLK